jgi:hypothetical protein
VAKNPTGRYTPGRRGWLKIKTRVGAKAIVGGVTGSVSKPQTVLLGRFDAAGRLRHIGRSHPLSANQQRELGPVLSRSPQRRRGGIDHPWPQPLPTGWSGHFQKAEPLAYIQVEPCQPLPDDATGRGAAASMAAASVVAVCVRRLVLWLTCRR